MSILTRFDNAMRIAIDPRTDLTEATTALDGARAMAPRTNNPNAEFRIALAQVALSARQIALALADSRRSEEHTP